MYQIRISTFMRHYAPFKFQTTRQWLDEDRRPRFSVKFLIDFQPDSEFLPVLMITHLFMENGQSKEISYPITLLNTRCNFGGDRYWFQCPLSRGAVSCKRRVGVLYFNGSYFGCRHCVGYVYDSKSLNYRSSSSAFIALINAQELESKTKRYTWRGKDTRKMRHVRKLYERAGYPGIPDMLIRLRSRREKNLSTAIIATAV